jgi:hypothetical protein
MTPRPPVKFDAKTNTALVARECPALGVLAAAFGWKVKVRKPKRKK